MAQSGCVPSSLSSMLYYAAALLILLIAWIFQLSLLSYSMYALVAVMLLSRLMARSWTQNVVATRECNREECEVGDTLAVVINVQNRGAIPVAWLLMEDLLPRDALIHTPPKLRLSGQRFQLAMIGPHKRRT